MDKKSSLEIESDISKYSNKIYFKGVENNESKINSILNSKAVTLKKEYFEHIINTI